MVADAQVELEQIIPLALAEKSNGAVSRKPRNREVSSRYKSVLPAAPVSRRFPSPNFGRAVDSAAPEPPKRALSAERKRSSDGFNTDEGTRSSVSSLNEGSKIDHALKPAANGFGSNPSSRPRGSTPERKRHPRHTDQTENARPLENVGKPEFQKWPATTNGKSISRSLDLSLERERGRVSSIGTKANRCLASARSFNQLVSKQEDKKSKVSHPLQQPVDDAKDDTSRVRSLPEEASCDTDTFASEIGDADSISLASSASERASFDNSVSAAPAVSAPAVQKINKSVRGTVVPARFWQDLGNRIRRLSDVNQLRSSMPEGDLLAGSKTVRRSKGTSAPTSAATSPANPTPWIYSPVRAPPAPPPPLSPSATGKVSSPSRALPSPTRTRPPSGAIYQGIRPGSVACMLNFGGDISRGKKAMSQQEEAQYLRILHNRWLQWRFVNARAESALSSQQATGERMLYSTSLQISDLQNRVAEKRIMLQKARQDARVDSIVASHGEILEEWGRLEQHHSSALSGAIEALEAGTLKVPVTAGAKVDVQALLNALSCAADAMGPLESTTRNLFPRAEETSEIVSQLAQVSAQGKALLQECGDLLDRIATLEIEERSLRSCFVQMETEKKRLEAIASK